MASSPRKGSRAAATSAAPTQEQPVTEVTPARVEPPQAKEPESATPTDSEGPVVAEAPPPVAEAAPLTSVAAPIPDAIDTQPRAALFEIRNEFAKAAENPLTSIDAVQNKVRSIFETGIAETRANFSKAQGVAVEATSAIETSYANAKTGVVELNIKTLEALKANADANFDFVKSAFSVKTAADYLALHTEFARKQIELIASNTKFIAELAQKVAADSVDPIKSQVSKTFKAIS